jgi:hypothetical protein
LYLVWVGVAREGSWERTTTLKIRKNFWVLNNGHQSEEEEGDHEERAVVIIFACCQDHHRANGLKKRGECWEIKRFTVSNIRINSASSSVTCFDSEIILDICKFFDLHGLADYRVNAHWWALVPVWTLTKRKNLLPQPEVACIVLYYLIAVIVYEIDVYYCLFPCRMILCTLFNSHISGFDGLGVACWPLVPKFAGSNPAEAVEFFRAKKSSALLRRGSKAVCPMS